MSRSSLALLLLACGPMPAPMDGGSDAPVPPLPTVVLPEGVVRGVPNAGVVDYLGIPYAEPPVGPLRFAAPRPHPGWSTPIGPVRSPPSCPQTALGLAGGGEDCLVINVHVPNGATNAPVMVWIHGGAFLVNSGIGLDRSTQGDIMARRENVIVVSMNYRLGPFGFFRYPGISEGNQGFLDQQLALQWVRDHIAAFGGNPDDVTLFGESAGGLSVCLHMISPGSAGLFRRAISESGLCDSHLSTIAEADASGVALVRDAGCEGMADVAGCMRAATVNTLFMAAGDAADLTVLLRGTANRPFWALVDGTVIPAPFRDRVRAGQVADVPVILGWNRDEGSLFVGLAEMAGEIADAAAYDTTITSFAARAGVDAAMLRAAYPLASYPEPGAAIADIVGDAELICPSRRAALLLRDAGRTVHVYRFDYEQGRFQLMLPRTLGAFHSAEIQFVFGRPVGIASFMGPQVELHDAMRGAWANFARGASPRDGWPAFDTMERAIVLDETIEAGMALNRDECALWDAAAD